MNTTPNATRIHPLMAAAAASVIIVSLTGAAAITGILPTSRSAPEPQAAMAPAGMPLAAPVAANQLQAAVPAQYATAPAQYAAAPNVAPAAPLVVSAAPGTTTTVQAPNAPAVIVKQEPAPVVKRTVVEKPRVIERTKVVHVQEPAYRPAPAPVAPAPAPAPAPTQPNYVGIGTGAVIGGLIGNQIGGGNGKKLATVAGIIGGGYLGNQIANRQQQNGQ